MPIFSVQLNKDEYDAWYQKVGAGVAGPIQRTELALHPTQTTRVLVGRYKGQPTGTGYVLIKENGNETCIGSVTVHAMEATSGKLPAP